jgi:hypothetical protein
MEKKEKPNEKEIPYIQNIQVQNLIYLQNQNKIIPKVEGTEKVLKKQKINEKGISKETKTEKITLERKNIIVTVNLKK